MFNLSGSEIIVILLLALVVLGPEKLPDALRRAGRTYSELKKMSTTFQAEVKSALDEPMKEMRDTADLMRNAADFSGSPAPAATPTPTPAVAPAPAAPVPATASPAPAIDEELVNRTLSGGDTPSSVDAGPTTEEPVATDESPTT